MLISKWRLWSKGLVRFPLRSAVLSFGMGFLITEEQQADLILAGVSELPSKLTAILTANHARVLDFFRSVDTNFDGCISRGEMQYAMHNLGLNASPKEIDQLFDALDPDGNGVLEFAELKQALQWAADGTLAARSAARRKKLPTAADRAKQEAENRHASAEVNEMIYEFERLRGLNEPGTKRPPSAQVLRETERMERLQAQARRARANKASAPVPRGNMMSKLDDCWVKSALLRPQTAPARVAREAAASRRRAEMYDFWVTKHRGEIESHQLMVQKEYADDKRMRRERIEQRRDALLSTMRSKRAESKVGASRVLTLRPTRASPHCSSPCPPCPHIQCAHRR